MRKNYRSHREKDAHARSQSFKDPLPSDLWETLRAIKKIIPSSRQLACHLPIATSFHTSHLHDETGHVLLHEITHLDAVAKQWLPE